MIQQLSLFAEQDREIQWKFADKVCEEFNKLNTVWKNNFYVKKCNLEMWEHVKLDRKVLCISIKARNWTRSKTFIQFDGDRESQLNLYNAAYFSKYIADLEKDKGFSISITPWSIYIYYHNFEKKKFDL